MMNRNASYVALTRHREGVQVYTDRETFADRDHLDRSLSRAPSKDLARDYAAAIERHAARLEPLKNQAAKLRKEVTQVRWNISIVEDAGAAARKLSEDRAHLVTTAGRVYTHPAQVVERLIADPRASDRFTAEHAAVYGQVHGRAATLLRRPDRAHQEAQRALPALRNALDRYHGSERAAALTQERANAIGESLPKLRDQLHQLNRALQ
jgi:hypothetical protein